MENAEVLFKKMKDTTLSRFFGSADRTGIEVFTKGVMEPLGDPALLEMAKSLYADGGDIGGRKLTIRSTRNPDAVHSLLAVLLAFEPLLRDGDAALKTLREKAPDERDALKEDERDADEIVITVSEASPPGAVGISDYTKTGEVAFFADGHGVLTLFLSDEGALLRHPTDPTRIADYVSTVLHEIGRYKTQLASSWELGQVYMALENIRSILPHGAPAWRLLDMSCKIAEQTAQRLDPLDPGLAKTREVAADAWLVSKVLKRGIWDEYQRVEALHRREAKPGKPGVVEILALVVNSHIKNIVRCEKGNPPPVLFKRGVVKSETFERWD